MSFIFLKIIPKDIFTNNEIKNHISFQINILRIP